MLPTYSKPCASVLNLSERREDQLLGVAVDRYNRSPQAAREVGYLPRQLVDATLPHRDPGDVAAFEKTNGRYRLAIQAGPGIGFPYGSFPRLLLIHLATEAVRTRSRRVTLGPSLLAFLRSLGLPTTGGKRGTIPRFRDQTIRLLSSRIVSFYAYGTDTKGGKSMRSVQVATRYSLWWDDDARTDIEHASWVEL